MTRGLVVGGCFALASAIAVAGQQPGTATLGGRVFHDGPADRPSVARVMVTIDAADGQGDRKTMTDDEGRFLFEGLPAGRFLVTATKAGWAPSFYGSTRPGRPPGVRVAVDAGNHVNIEVPIVRGSVIAGRIVDQDGQPMARQFPWLLEYRMVGDQRMIARTRFPYSIGSFERSTNDLGEFRLFGLPPGTYYLGLSPTISAGARVTTSDEVSWAMQPPGTGPRPAPPPGPVAGYARLYYPGTPDPGGAQPIEVGPGEVREGLEFRVQFVPVARVQGVARRSDGAPAAGTRVSLDARLRQVSLEGSTRIATASATGQFIFQNVPPGDYRISARAASAAPAVLDLWGQADVVVSGQDVEGVGLTLAPASVLTGRLAFTSTSLSPPADLSTVRLQFIATAAHAAALTGAGSLNALHTATVNPDGTFRVAGLPPDRYNASATWPGMRTGDDASGWWLTTIGVGGRDLGDSPIDVRPNEDVADVTIGFSDRVGTIEGTLMDPAGRPAPEYFVLAYPVDRLSWTTTSRRSVPAVRPATDGRYRIAGLLDGEYYLAVVTAVEPDDTTDAAFLDALVPLSIRITIAGGETRRQDLRVGSR